MSKRKPSFRVDQVLPDDDRLGARSNVWRTIMDRLARSVGSWFALDGGRKRKLAPDPEGEDPGEPPPKFSKKEESVELDIDAAINSLDYEVSDDSEISDVVESGVEEDSDQENREELNKQLVQVVSKRKPIWQRNGLHKLMTSIEDPTVQINMLSHEKVENWLLNRSAAAGSLNREISQGQETTILEKTVDGDRMKFHRKQHLTVSTKDDEDSLYSVDTAKYILSNKNKNSRSQIKVYKQVIKQYTMISTANGANGTAHPKLHSISNFPIIPEEQLSLSASHADVRHRSDSAIETGGGTSMEQMSKLVSDRDPSKSSNTRAPAASRKKVFKKTMKKKPTAKERSVTPTKPRTANNKSSPPAQVMERALRNGAKVKKIPAETRTTKPATTAAAKNRRIHWKETSISGRSATRGSSQNTASSSSSSEDEENNEVFTRSKSRQKSPPKRETRRRPTRRNNASSNSESSPPKAQTPPRRQPTPTKSRQLRSKNLEKDLVAPFEAISLSPRKRLDLTTNNTINQTTNMTALFSGANEKITNSTEINATTSNPGTTSFANSTASSKAARIPGFPDQSRCLVVYEPRQIQTELPPDARMRIQMSDLNLTGVTKPRHLEKFAKFNYYIHPNSSVRFFPSDSEDDEPVAVPPVSINSSDEDISYDDDDPILTFNPRYTDRLNVVEVRHD
ncbi:conserved hypothetical protein [Culex quinquefasciatus]|uniref:Uncharacterized protein n=1 Tax=Culex quinquefasciatus TaxID=7176 RepID=B0W3D4_CULQU|nr:conserved hypothetical protein [Culex quinquefasciatus]|eukprot:XP_001843218.1 conserved hypothetical protein [Culex quinquefasciatus]